MTTSDEHNPIARLQYLWQRLQPLPGGAWIFSRILGWAIPYSGSIGANVKILNPGYAKIELRDRRRVRNHLRSVHALALANLGELTGGLAMSGALPASTRGIPIKLTIEFFKKARGLLIAESHCSPPDITEDADFNVVADIRDAEGDVVARISAIWRLSSVPATQ